ncbi:MAG: prolipoprotein diacylglyceryl transferase [Candidatus Peregrinibacteria bacterium]|nr:prolipoprotein diacylglyceryl transferase [Candidatus Peregrinibacteria bacterium]
MFPVIFSTNFFELHTLWVFFAIALIISTIVLIRLSLSNGLKVQFISTNAWKIILWGIVGARIWSIINNYTSYFSDISLSNLFRLFYFWDKGLELWGAIIAATIYFYLLCKKNEQNFWKWLDVIVPATILGLAIGGIGTFFDGTNYGTPSSLPWAVNFDNAAIKYSVPIHPTQIYTFLYSSIIFTALILIGQNQKVKEMDTSGLVGLIGVASFCFFHFLEEFVRGDDALSLFSIRIPQIAAFIATIASLIVIYRRFLKKRSSLHSK